MAKSGSINLIKADETVVDLTGQVHQLPCCIKQTGPSSVSHYFKPKPTGVEIDGLKVEEAYFRGRKLQGATIPLPEGYSGSNPKIANSISGFTSSVQSSSESTAE